MDFYGTIGPACADVKLLQQMVEAGMTGIRMNLSHGPLAAHKDWLVMLHKAGVKKLLIDLQGPELRIGRLPQPLSLTAGQTVRLGAQGIPCPAALVHSCLLYTSHCYFLLTFVTIYKLPAQKEKMRRRKCRRTHCDAGKIMRSG